MIPRPIELLVAQIKLNNIQIDFKVMITYNTGKIDELKESEFSLFCRLTISGGHSSIKNPNIY